AKLGIRRPSCSDLAHEAPDVGVDVFAFAAYEVFPSVRRLTQHCHARTSKLPSLPAVSNRTDHAACITIIAVCGRRAYRDVCLVSEVGSAQLELNRVPEVTYEGFHQRIAGDLNGVR